MSNLLVGDRVKVRKIVPTGARYLPRSILYMTGRIIARRSHHDKKWVVVSFKPEKPSFSHMVFGNAHYDFLEEELSVV